MGTVLGGHSARPSRVRVFATGPGFDILPISANDNAPQSKLNNYGSIEETVSSGMTAGGHRRAELTFLSPHHRNDTPPEGFLTLLSFNGQEWPFPHCPVSDQESKSETAVARLVG